MHTGRVKFFNQKSKFGFITEDGSGKEFYVHIKDAESPLAEGDLVSFELQEARRGPQCVQVKKISAS